MISKAAVLQRLGAVEAKLGQRRQAVPDAVALMRQAGLEPDAWQQAVLATSASRVLLNCCRQSGKSLTCTCLALTTALKQAGALILLLSPSLRQSQELFQKVLTLYRPQAGQTSAAHETSLRLSLRNGSRIISLPGTEQTIRGYSSIDLLVIDEAARVHNELYYNVRPMLAISQGRLIAVSTPFGQRGWFYKEWAQGEHWVQIRIPATDCPRISAAFLEEERRSLPDLWFKSEYQCQFVNTVGQVFASADIEAALRDDVQPLFVR